MAAKKEIKILDFSDNRLWMEVFSQILTIQ
jgi:hypothetical protein